MEEARWITALGSLDWTAIVVALLSGTGLVGIIIQDRARRRRKTDTTDEPQATESVSATFDPQALKLAQQAMDQVSSLSVRLTVTEERLTHTEQELGTFKRAYIAVYWWGQRVIFDWDTIREQPDPPDLPPDIPHP